MLLGMCHFWVGTQVEMRRFLLARWVDKSRSRSAATEAELVQICPRKSYRRCLILCRVLSWFVDESYRDIVGFCFLCLLSAVYCRFCSELCLVYCLFLSWFDTNDVKTRIRQKGASIDKKSDKVSLKNIQTTTETTAKVSNGRERSDKTVEQTDMKIHV